MSNVKVTMLKQQLQGARQVLEATIGDIPSEVLHWKPQGLAVTIAANYAHVVVLQDGLINGLLKSSAPLFTAAFAGKTGLSELPPLPSPDSSGQPSWHEWGQQVQMDLTAFRTYAQEVYQTTDEYMDSLTDADLERNIVIPGLGENNLFSMLNAAVLSNLQWHTGEISCLKGLQNLRGYPF